MLERRVLVLMACLSGAAGCDRLGYTNRVLHRVPAPDGLQVAVCQEIPAFDGPGYDVRLERPDGTLLKRLYTIGDGDPCSEVVWSPDGRRLAVLSSHVARFRIVEVAEVLERIERETAYWSHRQVDFSTGDDHVRAQRAAFVTNDEVQFESCRVSLAEARRTRGDGCVEAWRERRVRLPRG